MKIAVMSDLHLEFEAGRTKTPDWPAFVRMRAETPSHPRIGPMIDNAIGVDLVILAGDTDVGLRGIDYAREISDYLGAPVIYVMGNHEPYDGTSIERLLSKMRTKTAKTNGRVKLLENDSAIFDDIYVLGATLWTDYEALGHAHVENVMREAKRTMNDHALCFLNGTAFAPSDARSLHSATRAWLDREVATIRGKTPDAKIVIVTHHAPILEANPPQYRNSASAPAFVSNMRPEIAKWRPALWISGHTHHSFDLMHGTTRLLSNQRGYVGQEVGALNFRPIVVEL